MRVSLESLSKSKKPASNRSLLLKALMPLVSGKLADAYAEERLEDFEAEFKYVGEQMRKKLDKDK